jgi:hypothetical protein
MYTVSSLPGIGNSRVPLRITGFLDVVHHPEFVITIKHDVSEVGSLSMFR